MGTRSGAAKFAEELCRKFPDAANRTLARKLYEENEGLFSNLELARRAIRYVRGSNGKAMAKRAKVPRKKGVSGEWVPKFPPTFAEEWKPVELPRPCRVLSLSDLHVPYHSERAIETAVQYAKEKHNPNILLLNGDYGDWYQLSRFQKNHKKRHFKEELEAMREGLSWLRGQFPRARRIFKLGNHDERWNHYIYNHAPEIADCDFAEIQHVLQFDKFGFERVDDQPVMAGALPILHGHEFGKSGIAAPVNPARGAFLRTIHSCLVGHSHRTSTHCEPDMFKREITTWSQGCLCELSPEYARINKMNQGFAVVEVDKDGQFDVYNYRLSRDYKVRTA